MRPGESWMVYAAYLPGGSSKRLFLVRADGTDAHEIVTFHDPQTFGDSRTRRRAALSDIASVTVLADMDYSFNENDG